MRLTIFGKGIHLLIHPSLAYYFLGFAPIKKVKLAPPLISECSMNKPSKGLPLKSTF